MLTFRQFIQEQEDKPMPAKKNLHLEHIEDEIFNFGAYGARESITFLQSLRDMLSGSSPNKKVEVTTKFDGAPAIFVGIDPYDGQFFVGTKGVFNVNAKYGKFPKNHQEFILKEIKSESESKKVLKEWNI